MRLVVKITCAGEELERTHQACSVAAAALASGVEVEVFLAGEGVHLARPDFATGVELAHAPPLGDLVDGLYAGATITVCSPCAARRELGEGDFRAGTTLAGAAAFVAAITEPDTQALVY